MMGNLCGLPKSRVPSKESVVTSFRVRWMGALTSRLAWCCWVVPES